MHPWYRLKSGPNKLALIIGDFEEQADLALKNANFEVARAPNESAVIDYLNQYSPHVILIHFSEDMRRSIDCITEITSKDPTTCIFYLTEYGRERVHTRAMKAGAFMVGSESRMSLGGLEFGRALRDAYEESIRRKHGRVLEMNVFVLMPFAETFDRIYKSGINQPLTKNGFICERVDQIHFEGDILHQILKKIQDSHFLVADMTGQNPNVFYEVGFAHAIDKKVILLAQSTSDIPFDLRRHRHIIYRGDVRKLGIELVKTSLEVKEEFERTAKGVIKL